MKLLGVASNPCDGSVYKRRLGSRRSQRKMWRQRIGHSETRGARRETCHASVVLLDFQYKDGEVSFFCLIYTAYAPLQEQPQRINTRPHNGQNSVLNPMSLPHSFDNFLGMVFSFQNILNPKHQSYHSLINTASLRLKHKAYPADQLSNLTKPIGHSLAVFKSSACFREVVFVYGNQNSVCVRAVTARKAPLSQQGLQPWCARVIYWEVPAACLGELPSSDLADSSWRSLIYSPLPYIFCIQESKIQRLVQSLFQCFKKGYFIEI